MSWPTDRRDASRLGLAVLGAMVLHAGLLAAVGEVRQPPRTPVPPPGAMLARFDFKVEPRATELPPAGLQPPPRGPEAAPPQVASPVPATGRPGTAAPPAGDEFAGYLRRREVGEPAQPAANVDVPFPSGLKGTVDLRVEVTLFVDEHGTVRHVRIDTPDVHPLFADAIRESFSAAPFVPGKVEGEPVRSRVRLEVHFSNTQR